MKKGSIVLYQENEYKIIGCNETHALLANNEGTKVAPIEECSVIREFVSNVKAGDKCLIPESAFNERYEGYAFQDSFASDENGEMVAIVMADQTFIVAPVPMLAKEGEPELVTSESSDEAIHGTVGGGSDIDAE